MVKLLQSKSTKSAHLSASFSESWGTVDLPNWGPLFGLNSLPRGPHSLKLQKVPICSQAEDSVSSSIGCWQETDTHSSLCAAISVFFHSTECGATCVQSLAGALFVSFLPRQALFKSLSLGNCTVIGNNPAFTIIKLVLPTHSLLPSLKAAPSVALPLNPACLKVSTWLHVHIPTLITV